MMIVESLMVVVIILLAAVICIKWSHSSTDKGIGDVDNKEGSDMILVAGNDIVLSDTIGKEEEYSVGALDQEPNNDENTWYMSLGSNLFRPKTLSRRQPSNSMMGRTKNVRDEYDEESGVSKSILLGEVADHIHIPKRGVEKFISKLTVESTGVEEEYEERVVLAPPGKLGIVVIDAEKSHGPVIVEVKPSSPLREHVFAGDRIISIDDTDTRGVSAIKMRDIMGRRVGLKNKIVVASKIFITNDEEYGVSKSKGVITDHVHIPKRGVEKLISELSVDSTVNENIAKGGGVEKHISELPVESTVDENFIILKSIKWSHPSTDEGIDGEGGSDILGNDIVSDTSEEEEEYSVWGQHQPGDDENTWPDMSRGSDLIRPKTGVSRHQPLNSMMSRTKIVRRDKYYEESGVSKSIGVITDHVHIPKRGVEKFISELSIESAVDEKCMVSKSIKWPNSSTDEEIDGEGESDILGNDIVSDTSEEEEYSVGALHQPGDDENTWPDMSLSRHQPLTSMMGRTNVRQDKYHDEESGVSKSIGVIMDHIHIPKRGVEKFISKLSVELAGVEEEYEERVVLSPPGKLGLILIDGKLHGPVILEVKPSSPLREHVFAGDRIISINDTDTRGMSAMKMRDILGRRVGSKNKITLASKMHFL